jgi:four helix bundle protein
MDTHKDLIVWQKSMNFVTEIYKMSLKLPNEEKFGLISQIKRASVSIPSNIAEGASRKGTKEFIHFLYISLGSCSEVETQLIICENLGYIEGETHLNNLYEIKRMLIALIKSIKSKI